MPHRGFKPESSLRIPSASNPSNTPSIVNVNDNPLFSNPSNTPSIVDVNDNPPIFVRSLFHLNVLDSSLDGASVGVVLATDADSGKNSQLFYTIQPTEFSHLFE